MRELKRTWLEAIADAREMVRDLPPNDSGCLYWNATTKKFVTPAGGLQRLVRHFGRPGGVLPSIGDDAVLSENPAARRLLASTAANGPRRPSKPRKPKATRRKTP